MGSEMCIRDSPVLHGLDGRLYCPHFKEYRAVHLAAPPVSKESVHAVKGQFSAAVLPVDGPFERHETDLNYR